MTIQDVATRNILWTPHGQGRRLFWIDFEYSRQYSKSDLKPRVKRESFFRVPEREEYVDPFAVDVYRLGRAYEHILEKVRANKAGFQWASEVCRERL